MSEPHDHQIDTEATKVSLDNVGPFLHGLGDLMHMVGIRMWKCYHAAIAGNRAMARFQLAEATSLLEKAAFLRPAYAFSIESFVEYEVDRMRETIEAGDRDAFADAFDKMVSRANAYHELFDRPFIQWRVPAEPPADLDLTPRD